VALALLEHQSIQSVKALNPFDAPGSLAAERQRIRRERSRFVVWTIVGANLLMFLGLLIQGCQREPTAGGPANGDATEITSSDTNSLAATQPGAETNSPIAPSFMAPTTNAPAEAAVANPTPEPVQAGTRQYVVVKGDSFYKIARANNISMKALADANPGVDSAKLKIGQMLQIPGGAEPAIATATPSPAPVNAKAGPAPNRYVVKSGDTLDRIARTHGTTVRAIKAANGLTGDRIVVGRKLNLPATHSAAYNGA
jgi:LysM repeat protein